MHFDLEDLPKKANEDNMKLSKQSAVVKDTAIIKEDESKEPKLATTPDGQPATDKNQNDNKENQQTHSIFYPFLKIIRNGLLHDGDMDIALEDEDTLLESATLKLELKYQLYKYLGVEIEFVFAFIMPFIRQFDSFMAHFRNRKSKKNDNNEDIPDKVDFAKPLKKG